MKRKLLIVISVIFCGAMLTNCGGGKEKAGGGSKIKRNEYLGDLPKIYANYQANYSEFEKKYNVQLEKLLQGGEKNYSKIEKLADEREGKEKEMKAKLKSDVSAEVSKLAGKEIPVKYSEELKNSGDRYYDIRDAKLAEHNGEVRFNLTVASRNDLTVPYMKGYDYTIYYILVDGSGNPLQSSKAVVMPIKLDTKPQSFKAGEAISQFAGSFSLSNYADRANFAAIQFITKGEYDKVQ